MDNTNYTHPHLGKMLNQFLNENRISKSELAKKLGVGASTVGHYIKQESLPFRVLWKICIALQHDFLSELQQHFPPVMPTKPSSEEQERIKDLEKELAIYKKLLKIEEN